VGRLCLFCVSCVWSRVKIVPGRKTSIKVSSLLYTSSSISLLLWNCLRAFTLNSIQITDREHLALFSVALHTAAGGEKETCDDDAFKVEHQDGMRERALCVMQIDRQMDGWTHDVKLGWRKCGKSWWWQTLACFYFVWKAISLSLSLEGIRNKRSGQLAPPRRISNARTHTHGNLVARETNERQQPARARREEKNQLSTRQLTGRRGAPPLIAC
jgi:hypothetical protein